ARRSSRVDVDAHAAGFDGVSCCWTRLKAERFRHPWAPAAAGATATPQAASAPSLRKDRRDDCEDMRASGGAESAVSEANMEPVAAGSGDVGHRSVSKYPE